MIFRAIPLRFEFEARDAIWFPPGKAGNTFRGALGTMLPPALFAPRGNGSGPSGFDDPPRPFVLRTAGLDGRRFEPGDRFGLGINVFGGDIAALRFLDDPEFRLGPHRGRVQLIARHEGAPIEIDLAAAFEPASDIRVEFLTPTELKFGGMVLREPRFDVLFARTRDRVAWFCDAQDLDLRALGERARHVTTTALRIEQTEIERRSSRTGQRHGIGGFIGEADYAGDLGEFVPWLRAAEWTGAGRYTVWGNGLLRVRILAGVSGDHVPVEPHAGRGNDAVLPDSET